MDSSNINNIYSNNRKQNSERLVLLIDGACNLCNKMMQFIYKRDSRRKFSFDTLQSKTGQALLVSRKLPINLFDTVVLIKGNQSFIKSSAILHIMKEIGGGWKIFFVLILIPSPVRDFLYNIIAKTRYKVFGKNHDCEIS